MGRDGAVWHLWQTVPGTWAPANAWTSRGSPPARLNNFVGFSVAPNADGRLEIFAQGGDGAVYHTWQTSPNNGWARSWASRGQPPGTALSNLATSRIAVGRNADGRLEVFAAGLDGAIWHTWQTAPNDGWPAPGAWSSRGRPQGVRLSTPSVGTDAHGRLQLVAGGDDGRIYHTSQVAPNDGWTGAWSSLGRPSNGSLSDPEVGKHAGGRVEIFARGSDGGVWHVGQMLPNHAWPAAGSWHAFPALGTAAPGLLEAANNADGRLEVFTVGLMPRSVTSGRRRPVGLPGRPHGTPWKGSTRPIHTSFWSENRRWHAMRTGRSTSSA